MAINRVSIEVGIWQRYETYHFSVAASLAGAAHTFNHQGYPIKVQLPKKPKQNNWRNNDSPITCSQYRERSGRKFAATYDIHQIDTFLSTGTKRKVRKDALDRVNVSLFTRTERSRLDNVANSYEAILDDAFHYWIDVIRWKSGHSAICQYQDVLQKTRWNVYLMDNLSGKHFYTPPHKVVAYFSSAISKQHWKNAQTVLASHEPIPIWYIYISEARQQLRLGDQRRFIIDLAIAAETVIRQLSLSFLSRPINPAFQKLVGNVGVTRILENWSKLGFISAVWKNLRQEINEVQKLFDLRNRIMHRGEEPKIGEKACRKLGDSVVAFIAQGEKEIR